MRQLLPTLLTALPVLAGTAGAQTETFPRGQLAIEGGSSLAGVLGYNPTGTWNTTYYNLVDNTQTGHGARSLKALYLRRDGLAAADAAYEARSTTVTIRMAHADWSMIVNGDSNSDATYRKDAWVIVFNAKQLSLPSLAAKPASAPAPFSIKLPLDKAFAYSGQSALAMQLQSSPNNLGKTALYPLDAAQTVSTTTGTSVKLGSGCTVSSTNKPLEHGTLLTNYGLPGIGYLQLTVSGAPASVPTIVWLGASSPDLAFGACTKLYAMPQILLTGALTNASGNSNTTIKFPNQASYPGLVLYSQEAIADVAQPGMPLALSSGRKTTYPSHPVAQAQFAYGTVWTAANSWPSSHPMNKGTALVIGFDQ